MRSNDRDMTKLIKTLKESAFSLRNRVGAFLAALMVVTGAASLPMSAFGFVSSDGLGDLGKSVEIDVVTAKAIAYPVPATIGMSQGYNAFHPGVDIRAPRGSAIYAIEPGRVALVVNERYGYGRRVEIDHGNGKTSLYAHLDKIEVYEGDLVTAETEIGQVGLTGRTTGPHLHLEVRVNGRTVNPLKELASR